MRRLPGPIASLVVTCSLLLPGMAHAQQRPPKIDLTVSYRFDPGWPQKPADVEWAQVSSLAVDADGNIWTFHRGNIPIQAYRPDGTVVRSWGEGLFDNPHQVRVDHEGNVWTADDGNHTVRKFTPDGRLLTTFGTLGEAGADATHLNAPQDMAITASGDVFIAENGNSRVVHYDASGRFVNAWGEPGTAPGQFNFPHGIDSDSRGRLYVPDRNNARIQVFDQDGTFLAEWRNLMVPWQIWITPDDEIYVCGSTPMRWGDGPTLGLPPKDQVVIKFDPEGRVQEIWAFPKGEDGHEQPGDLNWAHGIAVDGDGNLYLGDMQGRRAQRFLRVAPGN